MLKIYDSITQTKNVFVPITPNKVKLYACGETVYDYCHLGHGRQMLVFDVVVRYLRYRGYEVNFVRNITDIDDKIINRANENGETITELTNRFIIARDEDRIALNALKPDHEPRATEYIQPIIDIINTLLEKGYAYIANNGDVYYDVLKFETYGQLAHQSLDELMPGVRVEVNEAKHCPLDFVLWKISRAGEPSWDSPWGKGRPGWHIECSAMSSQLLGDHFDIHGGGLDLRFPHHQNELAQSEAASGKKFVNTWMHTGFIQVDEEKMSKSLGNFTTIREALKEYSAEVIRYFMVASHYRSPLNYSSANMQSAKNSLERLYTALRDLPKPDNATIDVGYEQRFMAAMDDDFNTPEAIAVLFEIAHEINRLKATDILKAANLSATLKKLATALGLLQQEPNVFFQADPIIDKEEIERLINARTQARINKNWTEADQLRKQLDSMNIIIEDGINGTSWRKT
jgi:cysteinyl-tRNA synthetase